MIFDSKELQEITDRAAAKVSLPVGGKLLIGTAQTTTIGESFTLREVQYDMRQLEGWEGMVEWIEVDDDDWAAIQELNDEKWSD